MKKLNKYIIILVITSILLMPFSAHAMIKKETVFTNLTYNGKVKENIVNNNLSFIKDTDTEDDTILKDVLNISGKEKLTQKDNKLFFKYNDSDITYQGKTDKKLPLAISIKYYLNAKEISKDRLINKSGKIKIKINITNNCYDEKYNMHTPFVITLGALINSKDNKNIEIKNGKVVNTGTKNIVMGMAAPGLSDDLDLESLTDLNKIEISYETKKFQNSEMYLVATPKLLESNDLNVFNKLDHLSSNMNELQSGMNKLESGADKLETGSRGLSEGTNSLNKGIKKALKGSLKLKEGSKQVDDNLNKIINGIDDSTSTLDSKTKTLNEKIKEIKKLKEGNNEAINSLESLNTQIQEGVKEQTEALGGLDVSSDSYIEKINGAKEKGYIENELYESLQTYKTQYEGNLNLIFLFNNNNSTIDQLISSLQNSTSEIKGSLSDLNGYLTKLQQEGTNPLKDGNSDLQDGLNALYKGSKKLNKGSKKMANGTKNLKDGINKINKEGISKLTSYTKILDNYKDKTKKLLELSKNYKGYSSNNADEVIFVFKVNK